MSRWSARRRSLWPNDLDTGRRTAILAGSYSSLKDRAGVKCGRELGLCVFMMLCGACVTGGLLFSVSCHVRGERAGQVKDRAEPGRVSGAGGVLEVTGREPDDVAAGNRSRGLFARWYSVVFGPVPTHPVDQQLDPQLTDKWRQN